MGLHIDSLEYRNFRNYEHASFQDLGMLTLLIGKNGAGKTNVLEGIDLLSTGVSFRHPLVADVIRQGFSMARLEMKVSDENRDLTTILSLEPKKKSYLINGKKKPVADVRGILPAVSFVPDDLEIAKGSSRVRRRSLDELGSQLTKNYHVIKRDFEKALKYRNKLLKEEAAPELLGAINDTYLVCAVQLYCYRRALMARMAPYVSDCYKEISKTDEELTIAYVPSWVHVAKDEDAVDLGHQDVQTWERDEVKQCIESSLIRHAVDEKRRARSLVGPHNDKITLYLNGRDMTLFASQGQQRSAVLAWKLAEVEMVKRTVGTNPVLLLDDVMSELDAKRRALLVKAVDEDIQTFITATDLSPFDETLLSKAQVIHLEGNPCYNGGKR